MRQHANSEKGFTIANPEPARACSWSASGKCAYDYTLDSGQLRRGVSQGDLPLSSRLLEKLKSGKPISIAAIGGSVTKGRNAAREERYLFQLARWLQTAFPAQHMVHNGGVSASPIKYMNLCVREHVPADVDLVIVEYAVNQMLPGVNIAKAMPVMQYERMIRKLLAFESRPAVILLQTFGWSRGFNRIASNTWSSFFETPEDHFAVVAKYYGLPSLSLRDAIFHNVLRKEKGYNLESVLADCPPEAVVRNAEPEPGPGLCIHPSGKGHGFLASLLVHYLSETFTTLEASPYEPMSD
ncbi:hypothetical protein CYMTET_22694 [Cymbomonas tetramitiformis]|uniref:SGNH hydrolase-type esterase domain-containing protein n=1 Tax=Cymbomonas tetramitiformis TaxID=36881 RepID=A0AAE0FZD8_9CHLO|nr:hypothetical protein CYMTET_23952 [Cymbomonas tetramitiformis]KAK3268822.1 hypothetical protein CYMTET_22694 [Cymbomonas tetramitiformis]